MKVIRFQQHTSRREAHRLTVEAAQEIARHLGDTSPGFVEHWRKVLEARVRLLGNVADALTCTAEDGTVIFALVPR